MEEAAEWLDPFEDLEEDDPEPEKERFVVDDDAKAEWCLRKMREADQEVATWQAHFDAQLTRIKEQAERKKNWLKYLLQEYWCKVPHKHSKTQDSYQLPSGKLMLKNPGPKYDPDDPAFLAWLKESKMTDFIKVEESPRWGDFKKTLPKDENGNFRMMQTEEGLRLLTEDGEVVPGVKVIPQEPEFKVDYGKA